MNADDIPESVREDMDGKPGEARTFKAWLGQLPTQERHRMFGRSNIDAFERGAITQTALLTMRGRPLKPGDFGSQK